MFYALGSAIRKAWNESKLPYPVRADRLVIDQCKRCEMAVGDSSIFGAYEAKARFSELLERAAQGEEITITRHGNAVARLVPMQPAQTPESRRQIIAQMRKLSAGKRLEGVTVSELIAEGRR